MMFYADSEVGEAELAPRCGRQSGRWPIRYQWRFAVVDVVVMVARVVRVAEAVVGGGVLGKVRHGLLFRDLLLMRDSV
jgi:hypothetical protein